MLTGREKQNQINHPLYKRKHEREEYHFHVLLLGDGGIQQGSVVVNISEGGMLVKTESATSTKGQTARLHTGEFIKAFFVIGIRTFVISSKIVRILDNRIAIEFHRQQPQLLELLSKQELKPQSYHTHQDNTDIELLYPSEERNNDRAMYAKYLFTYLAGALTATLLLHTFTS